MQQQAAHGIQQHQAVVCSLCIAGKGVTGHQLAGRAGPAQIQRQASTRIRKRLVLVSKAGACEVHCCGLLNVRITEDLLTRCDRHHPAVLAGSDRLDQNLGARGDAASSSQGIEWESGELQHNATKLGKVWLVQGPALGVGALR